MPGFTRQEKLPGFNPGHNQRAQDVLTATEGTANAVPFCISGLWSFVLNSEQEALFSE